MSTRAARVVLLVLTGWAVGSLAWAMSRRVPYPYDLEWMEGGMLCHALQAAQGRPLYAPPSARFVSFAYTPLYPMAVAAAGRVFGVGYTPARVLSAVAFAVALLLAYGFVRRTGGSPTVALSTVAIVAAAFAPTGAWYELARVDSLFLALTAAGVLAGWWWRDSPAGAALAGAVLVAAFLAKQTASPFIAALGIALLLSRPRVLWAYLGGLALAAVPALWWLHRESDGWFWMYAFGLHRRHPFNPGLAFFWTPARLLLLLAPGFALVAWALVRRRSAGLLHAAGLAAAGVVAACLGAGTEWSYHNALIPGVFFSAVAAGVAAAALTAGDADARRRERAVLLLLGAAIACAPGGAVWLAARPLPPTARAGLELPLGYDLRPYVPVQADRDLGDALVERLRAVPGEVFVPYHSFYAHLAGKSTYLHAMNLADLQSAGLGPPRDLVEAIRGRTFDLVVLDLEHDRPEALDPATRARLEEETLGLFPRMAGSYELAERIRGPRVFSGGAFRPCCLARPRPR